MNKGLGENRNRAVNVILFVSVLGVVCILLGRFFFPSVEQDTNYYGKRCFNEQPRNTVETIILGSSAVHFDITPMEIFETYGTSAWALGSSWQSLSSSYYLLEEAYRLHPESLHNVMLEVLQLRYETNDYQRQLITDGMKYNDLKFTAYLDYTDNIKDAVSYTFPLVSYHSRWNDITAKDFNRQGEYRPYLRGYFLSTDRNDFEEYSSSDLEIPRFFPDPSAGEKQFEEEGLYYLKKIIDFCSEHGLRLVLIKTPMSMHWDDADHNAVESIAKKYGLEYLDFNYEPLLTETGINFASDLLDTDHLNYYGAKKFTAWLGNYLVSECGAADVRGKAGYEYLEEDLEEYKERVKDIVALRSEVAPAQYLSRALSHEDYTVFIMVDEDAATCLGPEQRAALSDLGLPTLAMLGIRDSYLAVIDPVKGIVYEDTEADPGDISETSDVTDNLTMMEQTSFEDVKQARESVEDEDDEEDKLLTYEGNLSDGGYYVIKSGGENLGNNSSCVLNDVEWAPGSDGLNIVVYDNKLEEVVDTAVFDTSKYPLRLGNDLEAELNTYLANGVEFDAMPEELQKLLLYNERCKEAMNQGAEGSSGDSN